MACGWLEVWLAQELRNAVLGCTGNLFIHVSPFWSVFDGRPRLLFNVHRSTFILLIQQASHGSQSTSSSDGLAPLSGRYELRIRVFPAKLRLHLRLGLV